MMIVGRHAMIPVRKGVVKSGAANRNGSVATSAAEVGMIVAAVGTIAGVQGGAATA
jgi:hypothetical protein